tara:strand:+ start:472 stop:1557 length:1086 start_codon:yes stop_codon:yes gene_type:complete
MKFCVLIFDTSYSKYTEYKNGEFALRNCGWGGFLSKYNYPFIDDDRLHLGIEVIRNNPKYSKYQRYIDWEGGPDVGFKGLLYNLRELGHEIEVKEKIEPGFDYYIPWYITSKKLSAALTKFVENRDIINDKIVFTVNSSHIDTIRTFLKKNNIKFQYWAHSIFKADFYLAYPIHKLFYTQYPLDVINSSRNSILVYTKTNGLNRRLQHTLVQREQEITGFFNKHNYDVLSISHFGKGYRRDELFERANLSKICIYLSFYDAGALTIGEITFMGCYIIGFINKHTTQQINHSVAPCTILEGETGEYINDFARICDSDGSIHLINGCKKVLDILNRGLDHVKIAKSARNYLTEERFLETVFKN